MFENYAMKSSTSNKLSFHGQNHRAIHALQPVSQHESISIKALSLSNIQAPHNSSENLLKSVLITSHANKDSYALKTQPESSIFSHKRKSANIIDVPIDPYGNTALHLAVSFGDQSLASFLLLKGADPNVSNAAGVSPLEITKISDVKSVKAISNIIIRFGCLEAKSIDEVRPLVKLPVSDILSIESSIHKMALLGQIRHLEKNHPTINMQLSNGTTPLMHAAASGYSQSIQKLLDHGADPRVLDNKGFSALAWASAGGWSDAINILLPVTPLHHSKASTSPVVIASYFGHIEVIAQLVKTDMSLFFENALLVASWMRHPRVISILIEAKISIPQPFSDWLAVGNKFRTDWEKACFVLNFPVQNYNMTGPIGSTLASHSPADLAGLETERILTLATPETAFTSGKAIIKSVPTKTAHAATSDIRAELSLANYKSASDYFTVEGGGVPLFRRAAVCRVLPGAQSIPCQPKFKSDNDFYSTLSASIFEKIPAIGTELSIICGSIGGQLIELIRRVQVVDKGKYTAIVVSIANHVQNLQSIIDNVMKQRRSIHPLFQVQKGLELLHLELIPAAMKYTRLAEAVWPTPNAENLMLNAVENLFVCALSIASNANILGIWPLGRINVLELISSCTNPMSAATAANNGISFELYKRANRLHVIDAIAQEAKTSKETTRSRSTSLSDKEEHIDDLQFACTVINPMLRQFVDVVRTLHLALTVNEKHKYIDLSHKIVATIDLMFDSISSYPLMQQASLTPDLCFVDNNYPVSECISRSKKEVQIKGFAIVQKGRQAAGVWPPSDATAELVDTLLLAGNALRQFIQISRDAIVLIRNFKAAEIAKDESRRKMWMHGEQVRKMFSIWESVTADASASKPPATQASLVLKDKGLLLDPPDGLVFHNGQIRGGRLIRLVEWATHYEKFDNAFAKSFLMTHHSFTTSHDLMAVLVKRYNIEPPLGIEDEDTFRAWLEYKLVPVRMGVLSVLVLWVSNYYSDFLSGSHSLLVVLREFLNLKVAPDFPIKAEQISVLLAKKLAALDHKESAVDTKFAPKSVINKAVESLSGGFQYIIDVDAIEVARQWTLIEAQYFRTISNKEWINQIWGRANEASRTKAPNIDYMIKFTNKITTLVAYLVVCEEKEKRRFFCIKYWIHVAEACANLNNYNAVTAVIAGLKMGPVRRLEKMWATFAVRHPKSFLLFNQLSETVSTSGQYLNYRKLLKTLKTPVVPFLGVYITDFTFIEDGNPDYLLDGMDHLINFEKRRKVASVIEEIATWQSTCHYHLHPVPRIQSFLTHLANVSNESDLYSLSVKVEPMQDDSDE